MTITVERRSISSAAALRAVAAAVLFGGGHPIVVDGAVVGGIGCSGGSEAQDSACALAGLEAIGLGAASAAR